MKIIVVYLFIHLYDRENNIESLHLKVISTNLFRENSCKEDLKTFEKYFVNEL